MRKTCVSSIFPSHLQKSPTTDNYVDGLLGNQAPGANHEVEEFKTHRRPRTPLRSRRTREISVLLESRRSLSSVPTSLTPKRGVHTKGQTARGSGRSSKSSGRGDEAKSLNMKCNERTRSCHRVHCLMRGHCYRVLRRSVLV